MKKSIYPITFNPPILPSTWHCTEDQMFMIGMGHVKINNWIQSKYIMPLEDVWVIVRLQFNPDFIGQGRLLPKNKDGTQYIEFGCDTEMASLGYFTHWMPIPEFKDVE